MRKYIRILIDSKPRQSIKDKIEIAQTRHLVICKLVRQKPDVKTGSFALSFDQNRCLTIKQASHASQCSPIHQEKVKKWVQSCTDNGLIIHRLHDDIKLLMLCWLYNLNFPYVWLVNVFIRYFLKSLSPISQNPVSWQWIDVRNCWKVMMMLDNKFA